MLADMTVDTRGSWGWRLAAAVCCAVLTAVTGPGAAVAAGPDTQAERGENGDGLTGAELRRAVERTLREAEFVGISVEVRDRDETIRARAGRAELGDDRPVPFGGYLRAGSATKPFVAVVVLQLVAEGELSLDDTVEQWLPGLVTGNGNDGGRITIRDLLQHTSGIYNYDYSDDVGDDSAEDFEARRFDRVTPEQLVAGAVAQPPAFAPGSSWGYSNPNYVLAGMIVERVTGRSWAHEVRERIVEPLGLTGTYAPGRDPRLPEPHAHTYHRFPGSDGYTDTTVRSMTWADAAGSLVSTERDQDVFFTALLDGRLLPPEQLAQMRQVVPTGEDYEVAFPGLHYGLGLMRQPLSCGGYRWGHGGDIAGVTVRNGLTGGGERSIVVNATGKVDDDTHLLRAEAALQELLDTALCEGVQH
jgi:D-alanyl-D-alanine carboxypeptidase